MLNRSCKLDYNANTFPTSQAITQKIDNANALAMVYPEAGHLKHS